MLLPFQSNDDGEHGVQTGLPAGLGGYPERKADDVAGQEGPMAALEDVDMISVDEGSATELGNVRIEAENEARHHILCGESASFTTGSFDEPCLCHRTRLRHQPHLSTPVSPLQDLLRNFKYMSLYGGAAIPFYPEGCTTPADLRVAAPSTEDEAHLATNFVINLRHAVGADLSTSAWNNLTGLQQEQFRVFQAMAHCMPALVRAILQESPAGQHSTLRIIANTILSMESLAGVQEDVAQEARDKKAKRTGQAD